ncbi:MAG: hypothetical protein IJ356_00050 [Erysipelotrichaceae bacterium]|nr:hypothetical protein [Erysipelotrichaceae bacterium]
MKLFDFLKKNSNRKTLTPRPSKTYAGELYYSYKQCYEDDFESDIITLDAINELRRGYFNQCSGNVSAGVFFNAAEWERASEGLNVFDNINCDYAVRNFDCTFSNETGLAYIPESIVMFDVDSATDYFIVIIDDVIEIRQSDVLIDRNKIDLNKLLDCSLPIYDDHVIEKMENTVIAALRVLRIRRQKQNKLKRASEALKILYSLYLPSRRQVNHAVEVALMEDNIWGGLEDMDYVKYIDERSEGSEILFSINQLCARFGLPMISDLRVRDQNHLELLAECSRYFLHSDYEIIGIRLEHGMMITMFKTTQLSQLENALAFYKLAPIRFTNKSASKN